MRYDLSHLPKRVDKSQLDAVLVGLWLREVFSQRNVLLHVES